MNNHGSDNFKPHNDQNNYRLETSQMTIWHLDNKANLQKSNKKQDEQIGKHPIYRPV